ncbi:MAG: ankyrin repeat domain-containing protein [Armatimonadota bacterium]
MMKLPWTIIITAVLLVAVVCLGWWAYTKYYWWPSSPSGSDIATAVHYGDGRRVQELLQADPTLATAPIDVCGDTVFEIAVARGDVRMVRLLLAQGADVKRDRNNRHLTREERRRLKTAHIELRTLVKDRPLDTAYDNGHLDIAELLLQHGADPTASLLDAVWAEKLEKVRFLVAHGADVQRPAVVESVPTPIPTTNVSRGRQGPHAFVSWKNGDQPIHLAVQSNNVDLVAYLLQHGSSVEAIGADGNTPLHTAAHAGAVRVVEYLLAQHASRDTRNSAGKTPLDVAIQSKAYSTFDMYTETYDPKLASELKRNGGFVTQAERQQVIDMLHQR